MIGDAAERCAPASQDVMTAALTRTLATGMGGPMTSDERTEWQLALTEELQDIPADLAIEALKSARRTCTRASEVLPHVITYVEDYPARRKAALRRLITLADVAGVEI